MIESIPTPAHIALIILGLAGAVYVGNRRLLAFYADRPHLKFRRQILQVAGALIVILVAILAMPYPKESGLRGDLLGLFGLIVSATIALSSTTLVGNVMAGIMLKTISSCKPGDYISVGDHYGRITEMDLLHTEIQTEQRDLTTLPNLFLVTHPVRVMRSSGTVLSVDLSLGYDVSRHRVEELLIEAATATGLETPYVEIRDLGDFSVTYAVAGILTEVDKLLTKRRELRGRTIDVLHAANIEIVSPSFMNTRAFSEDRTFIPKVAKSEPETAPQTSLDTVVFDKAAQAESVTRLREQLEELVAKLKSLDELIADASKAHTKDAAVRDREAIVDKIDRLKALIEKKEVKISGT